MLVEHREGGGSVVPQRRAVMERTWRRTARLQGEKSRLKLLVGEREMYAARRFHPKARARELGYPVSLKENIPKVGL